MTSRDTDRFEKEVQTSRPMKAPTRPGPAFSHFYVLLALVLISVGGAGYVFTTMYAQMTDLKDALQHTELKSSDARTEMVDAMKTRLDSLDALDAQLKADLARLRGDLDATRTLLVALDNKLAGQMTDIKKSIEDLTAALESTKGDFGTKLETARTELGQKHDQMAGKVAQLHDDSQYIISELGKKAEKAYLKFMERKIQKKIDKVSEKVDTVKGDLEQQIVTAKTRIEAVAVDLGKAMNDSIKKKVEEHVNIEFVPSTNDQE